MRPHYEWKHLSAESTRAKLRTIVSEQWVKEMKVLAQTFKHIWSKWTSTTSWIRLVRTIQSLLLGLLAHGTMFNTHTLLADQVSAPLSPSMAVQACSLHFLQENTFKSHVPAHFGRRRLQESIIVLDPICRAGYQCMWSIKLVSTKDASLKDVVTSTGRVWVAGCYSKKGKGKK